MHEDHLLVLEGLEQLHPHVGLVAVRRHGAEEGDVDILQGEGKGKGKKGHEGQVLDSLSGVFAESRRSVRKHVIVIFFFFFLKVVFKV